MGEWFNDNASAIIAASAALSGAVIAAIFAFINNTQNIRAAKLQRSEQYDFEKWKANRQIYIEKGEEAIGLITSLLNAFLGVVNASALDVVMTHEHGISDSVKNQLIDNKSGDNLNRLDTIIISYFPELIEHKSQMIKYYQCGIHSYIESAMGKREKSAVAIELLDIQSKLTESANLFKNKISEIISKHL